VRAQAAPATSWGRSLAGFLRFAVFSIALVGLLVFVVAPAVASPFLTQMLRDTGLRGEGLNVTLDYFDPSLIGGRAERLTIRGENVELPPALVGSLDVTLGRVSFVDRSFETITGEMRDVTLAAGGLTVEVARLTVDGPSSAASATARFSSSQTQQLVQRAARRAGLGLDHVRLGDERLLLSLGGVETQGAIAVRGGALVLSPEIGPAVLLLQPAPSDPWRLSDAYVSSSGVTVSGVFDAASMSGRLWTSATD
jgi:hypothetical protein